MLHCLIRKKWVADLPEEQIRQRLIAHMISNLGYPHSQLAVEQPLHQMPHLALQNKQKMPRRRIDLLCFSKEIHPEHAFYPLLIVECKAVPLSSKVLNQVIGYNHYIQARFIAVVNESEIRTGWYDFQQKSYIFINTLPAYPDLLINRHLA